MMMMTNSSPRWHRSDSTLDINQHHQQGSFSASNCSLPPLGQSPPFSPTTPTPCHSSNHINNINISNNNKPPPVSIPPPLRKPFLSTSSLLDPLNLNSPINPSMALQRQEQLDWHLRTGRHHLLAIKHTPHSLDTSKDRWGNHWGMQGHVLSPVISERTEPTAHSTTTPTSLLSASSALSSTPSLLAHPLLPQNSSLLDPIQPSPHLHHPSASSSSSSLSQPALASPPSPSHSPTPLINPSLPPHPSSLVSPLLSTFKNLSLDPEQEAFLVNLSHTPHSKSLPTTLESHSRSSRTRSRHLALQRDAEIAARQASKRAEKERRDKMLVRRQELINQILLAQDKAPLLRDLGKLYLDCSAASEAGVKLAIHFLEQSIYIQNRDPLAWLELAHAWSLLLHTYPTPNPAEREQRLSNSSLGFRKAISLSPPDQALKYRLAFQAYLERLQRFREAALVLQAALEADAENATCWFQLGRMMRMWADSEPAERLERARHACEAFERAYELDKNNQLISDSFIDATKWMDALLQNTSSTQEVESSSAKDGHQLADNTCTMAIQSSPDKPRKLCKDDSHLKMSPATRLSPMKKLTPDMLVIPDFSSLRQRPPRPQTVVPLKKDDQSTTVLVDQQKTSQGRALSVALDVPHLIHYSNQLTDSPVALGIKSLPSSSSSKDLKVNQDFEMEKGELVDGPLLNEDQVQLPKEYPENHHLMGTVEKSAVESEPHKVREEEEEIDQVVMSPSKADKNVYGLHINSAAFHAPEPFQLSPPAFNLTQSPLHQRLSHPKSKIPPLSLQPTEERASTPGESGRATVRPPKPSHLSLIEDRSATPRAALRQHQPPSPSALPTPAMQSSASALRIPKFMSPRSHASSRSSTTSSRRQSLSLASGPRSEHLVNSPLSRNPSLAGSQPGSSFSAHGKSQSHLHLTGPLASVAVASQQTLWARSPTSSLGFHDDCLPAHQHPDCSSPPSPIFHRRPQSTVKLDDPKSERSSLERPASGMALGPPPKIPPRPASRTSSVHHHHHHHSHSLSSAGFQLHHQFLPPISRACSRTPGAKESLVGKTEGEDCSSTAVGSEDYNYALINSHLQSIAEIDRQRRAEIVALRKKFDDADLAADRKRAEVVEQLRKICATPQVGVGTKGAGRSKSRPGSVGVGDRPAECALTGIASIIQLLQQQQSHSGGGPGGTGGGAAAIG